MPEFNPGPEDLRRILEFRTRAEQKAKDFLEEFRKNKLLVNGNLEEWEQVAPVPSVTHQNTIVVRNAIGQNVRDDADRLMPTDPRWEAHADTPVIFGEDVDPMTGETRVIEIDNVERAYKVRGVADFVSTAIEQYDEAYRALYDALTGGNGYILVAPPDQGADVSHTLGYPATREDTPEDDGAKVGKGIQRGKVLHSAVQPFLPVNIREAPENILLDPDATTDKEVNSMFRWVCRPLADVKADKSYKNTKNLKPNVLWDGLRYKPDLRWNMSDRNDSGNTGRPEMLGWWEYHYRVRAKPGESSDGYIYYTCSIVEQPAEQNDASDPTCIRHERYPYDYHGFAVKRISLYIDNDDLYGFAPPIRFSKRANGTENAMMSMMAKWALTNRTRRVWLKNALTEDDITMVEEGDANDNIMLEGKGVADIRQLVSELPATMIPESLPATISMLRGIANESSGRSANQRGQTEGVRTASEAQIVANETSQKMQAMKKRFQLAMNRVMRSTLLVFAQILPETMPNGKKWSIPDPENRGKFLAFSASELTFAGTLSLDYSSMQSSDDQVTVKRGQELLMILSKTPPQMLMAAQPLVERIALALGTEWRNQVAKVYDNLKKGSEQVGDPKQEHIAFLEGMNPEPDDEENFEETIPQHEAMVKNIGMPMEEETPEQYQVRVGAWTKPISLDQMGRPMSPMSNLVLHIEKSYRRAAAKGIVMPGMMQGGGGGGQPGGRSRGSGPGALRESQSANPMGGDLAGAAQGMEGMEGMGR